MSWKLYKAFQGYDNERSLAFHRIISAKATTTAFIRPKGFDLQKYFEDGRFGFGDGERVHLTFRITRATGAHLIETPLATDQQVTDLGDWYAISATVVDTAQLRWWLRGYGENVVGLQRNDGSF